MIFIVLLIISTLSAHILKPPAKIYPNLWLKNRKNEEERVEEHKINQKPSITPPNCGLTFFDSRDRIINGQKAAKNEFPWMAQLLEIDNLRDPNSYSKLFCGGSVLNGKYILSAAHCFINDDPYSVFKISRNVNGFYSKLRVALGKNNVNKFEKQVIYGYTLSTMKKVREVINQEDLELGSGMYRVKNIIIHGNYSYQLLNDDISLIELENTVYWNGFEESGNTNVRPVCLPGDQLAKVDENLNLNLDGMDCLILGWGILFPNSDTHANSLMYARQKILSMDSCKSSFMRSNFFLRVWDNKQIIQVIIVGVSRTLFSNLPNFNLKITRSLRLGFSFTFLL